MKMKIIIRTIIILKYVINKRISLEKILITITSLTSSTSKTSSTSSLSASPTTSSLSSINNFPSLISLESFTPTNSTTSILTTNSSQPTYSTIVKSKNMHTLSHPSTNKISHSLLPIQHKIPSIKPPPLHY